MFRYFNLLLILLLSSSAGKTVLSFQSSRPRPPSTGYHVIRHRAHHHVSIPRYLVVPQLSNSNSNRVHSSSLIPTPRKCNPSALTTTISSKLYSAKEGSNDKQSTSSDEPKAASKSSGSSNQRQSSSLDAWLSQLTSAFPLFVLLAAVIGITAPSAIHWVNRGNLIEVMLAGVMVGTGLTLEIDDFKQVLKKNWSSVPLGVICQFAIMPLAACLVGRLLLLPMQAPSSAAAAAAASAVAMATTTVVPDATAQAAALKASTPEVLQGMKKYGKWVASFLRFSSGSTIATPTAAAAIASSAPVAVVDALVPAATAATTPQAAAAIGPALFLGLCLVGASPGGTASNLVTLIAKANVALSVLLTSCSTMLAVVMTPLLTKLLVGSNVRVDGWALCQATARVVLGPVLIGMFLNDKAPEFSRWVSRFTPFASVVLVSLICGGVVALTAPLAKEYSSAVLPTVCLAVFLLHATGFLLGYAIPRYVFGKSETTARTVSIEVGMQNSALAVVLAKSVGAPAIAALPGALSATMHSCLGSLLSAYWRMREQPPPEKGQQPKRPGQQPKKNLPYAAPKDGEFEI